ncbi:adenylate/guanylate cyclase domain-containing protein [Spirochaetia bacterium]|nr:adenylate/guanylate cyclase domain-containing protein [Spirochaetia bacterium]
MSGEKQSSVRFPLWVKLVAAISIISLISLGAITMLSSWLITEDIRITAEDHNYEVNRLAAARTEETLRQMQLNTGLLFDVAGEGAAEKASVWFFDAYRSIAAVGLFTADLSPVMLLLNERFLLESGVDITMIHNWIDGQSAAAAARAVNGETLLLNAALALDFPLTACFFPWQNGAALFLFSADALAESYGSGANASFLVNGDADILVHPNAELVSAAANAGNDPFVRAMRENPQTGMQSLYTDTDGTRYFGAFTKLSLGNAAIITSIEYSRVFEGIAAVTRRNIYLTIAVLLIAGIVIWLFSRSITLPIQALSRAARQIEGGEFEVTLSPKTRDEIGELTESFGRMSGALEIFGRFTNRDIALRAMLGEIKPGGLPRHAAIMFTDIRGFTEKSETFTRKFGEEAPDKIVSWLNDYFDRMVPCVEKTGGVVDKFIGDALMAHWGAASTAGSPEEDALNAVRSALLMRAALLEMNKGRREGDYKNPPIHIGCGINTGMVIAGQIGNERRMEYTVVGDPVNLASRTEGLTKEMGTDILITESTWNLIGSSLKVKEMPQATVKGKTDPIRIFAVSGLRDGGNAKG